MSIRAWARDEAGEVTQCVLLKKCSGSLTGKLSKANMEVTGK
jgi:hypothetical protein